MLAQRALVLMYLGRFAEAEAYCRRCLAQKPDFVPVYSTLSRLRRGALDDADLQQLNELARNNDVYLDYRIAAIFAIANTHDARGEIDTAFAAYDAAHMLARERDAFERRSYDATQDAAHSAPWICGAAAEIPPVVNALRPIFIVGMPRPARRCSNPCSAHILVCSLWRRPAMRQILRWPTSLNRRRRSYQQSRRIGQVLLPRLAGHRRRGSHHRQASAQLRGGGFHHALVAQCSHRARAAIQRNVLVDLSAGFNKH
jgi:tetratricopeptide (TPR) repeat protein